MRYLLAFALALFVASPVFADFSGPGKASGGFKGPEAAPMADTVARAKELPDNARVVLTGYIVNQISEDEYTFRDATGEIQVDISRKRFRDIDVTPETMVRVYGKVDKEWNGSLEIDVKRIEIAK